MSQTPEPSLQFERAEFASEAPTAANCATCGQAIAGSYYTVNTQVTCEKCRWDVETARASGSRAGRVLRAVLYGTLAGALGAGLWYGVRALTGYEVGLIAIVVGVIVGQAVLKGSGGRGGRGYQVLAVALTYGSIVSTYVPMITSEFFKRAQEEPATPATGAGAPATPSEQEKPAETAPAAPAAPAPAPEQMPGAGGMLLAVVLFFAVVAALAVAAPFLGGFENILGIVIIAFGVWEAWKINRKTTLEITGPHRLAVPAADVA